MKSRFLYAKKLVGAVSILWIKHGIYLPGSIGEEVC